MHRFFNVLFRQVKQPANDLHILASSQMSVVRRGLNQGANGCENIAAVFFVERFPHNFNGSAGGLDEAEQHFHGGGLACPVRAEEAIYSTFRDMQIDTRNRCKICIRFR